MSKKLLIISSLILIIFVIALGSYYFLIQSNNKVLDGKSPSFSLNDFFPFGDNSTPDTTNSQTIPKEDDNSDTTNTNEEYTKKLRLISKEPVSGFGFLETKNGSVVRFLEKATGHIYDISTFSDEKTRISNTTIPKIQIALFANNAKELFAQYLNEENNIETFYASIIATSSEKALVGSILSSNIKEVSVSPKGNVFYIENDLNGSSGFISTPTNRTKKQVWSFPLKDFTGNFANDNTFIINTKPNSREVGYIYKIDTTTGKYLPVIQGLFGLSSKAGNDSILYFANINNGSLYYYSLKTNIQKQLSPKTFSDKCTFSKSDKKIVFCAVPKENISGESLDLWYFGTKSYSDDIWKYNTEDGTSNYILNLEKEAGEKIDVDLIETDQSGKNLVFRNKINGNLWSFKLD